MPERNEAERREIEKLLPFHASGTLSDDDAARVEAALADDPELRGELAFLRALRGGVKEAQATEGPGELGLRRLLRDVRRARRRDFVARAWRPALAAAAAVALVVQSALLLDARVGPEPDGVTVAGRGEADIQITFAPDATEVEIRKVLRLVGARIVDGPGALGVYHLAIEPPPADPTAWEGVVEALRARSDVVESVRRE